MKKFSKRLFTSLVAFCMLFAVSAVPAFAAETTTEITDTQQPVVIGEYDGYLTDVMISDGVTKRAVANVRINSYATYDEDDGIQVHVKLYVPWYESPKPEFTGMTGTVNVLMNKKSTNTAFAELADGEETFENLEEPVTGVYGTRVYSDDSESATITLQTDENILSFVGEDS